jgi:hypothetical protein
VERRRAAQPRHPPTPPIDPSAFAIWSSPGLDDKHRWIVFIIALVIGLPEVVWIVQAVIGGLLKALLFILVVLIVLRLFAPCAMLGGLLGAAVSLGLRHIGAALISFGIAVVAGSCSA